jgi:hypothetical protein
MVKCGSTILLAAGNLEQLQWVGGVAIEEWKHLGMHDAVACGEPLHVALAKAGGGAQ